MSQLDLTYAIDLSSHPLRPAGPAPIVHCISTWILGCSGWSMPVTSCHGEWKLHLHVKALHAKIDVVYLI